MKCFVHYFIMQGFKIDRSCFWRFRFQTFITPKFILSYKWNIFIICLFIQERPKYLRYDHWDLLNRIWTSSDVIRIYRPQYNSRVWFESPSSCITSFGIGSLNVDNMNHCIWFSTIAREEQTIFTCGVRFSSRNTLTYRVFTLFSGYTRSSNAHIWEKLVIVGLSLTFCTLETENVKIEPSC